MNDESLVSNWKVKLIFRGARNSLTAWPDWPDTLVLRQFSATEFVNRQTQNWVSLI